jgi:hypothetical protein
VIPRLNPVQIRSLWLTQVVPVCHERVTQLAHRFCSVWQGCVVCGLVHVHTWERLYITSFIITPPKFCSGWFLSISWTLSYTLLIDSGFCHSSQRTEWSISENRLEHLRERSHSSKVSKICQTVGQAIFIATYLPSLTILSNIAGGLTMNIQSQTRLHARSYLKHTQKWKLRESITEPKYAFWLWSHRREGPPLVCDITSSPELAMDRLRCRNTCVLKFGRRLFKFMFLWK